MTSQSTSPSAEPLAETPPERPGRRAWLALAVLVVAQLTVWLDNTILNVALETLADPAAGLDASPSELQWSISSYTLVFAVLLFTGGVLGDRFGHRRVLLAGMVVFGASSVWAAYAGDAAELVVARGVMGVGSALVVPATLSLITRVFDAHYRATAIAIWSGSSALAIAAGPLVSGALLERFWWGSVFLVNVPFVVVAIAGALAVVPPGAGDRSQRFDPLGVLLSTVGLFALVYGVIQGGHHSEWGRWDVLGPIGAGLVLLAAFALVEPRVRNPCFDLRLFGNPRFTGSTVAVMLAFFGLTGSMFYAIFYLQGVRGLSPLECGLTVAPVALGVALGGPLSAPLVRRFGIRPVVAPAMLLAAAALYGYVFFDVDTPLVWYGVLVVVQGLGLGAVMAPTTEAIMAELPPERTGAGSAVSNAMRQVGAVLGVAVLGSALAAVYRDDITPELGALPAPARDAAGESAEATRAVADQLALPELVATANDTFVTAMHVTTVIGAAVTCVGVVVVLVFFRPGVSNPTR